MEIFTAWPAALPVAAALVGLVVGSFLNVVAYRLPIMLERAWRAEVESETLEWAEHTPFERFDLSWPPSTCPSCGHRIAARHNVPVVSYVLLGGRCAHCAAPIGARYPIVESFTALASAVVATAFGPTWATPAALLFVWFLIALSLIDLDRQLLPDSLTLPLLWIGLVLALLPPPSGWPFADLRSAVIGAAAGYLSLWSVYHGFRLVTGKEGMGYGDFKLFAALGAWLGWQSLPVVILLAAGSGALVMLALIVFGGRSKDKPTPFGPFLAAGGFIALPWGDRVMLGFTQAIASVAGWLS